MQIEIAYRTIPPSCIIAVASIKATSPLPMFRPLTKT